MKYIRFQLNDGTDYFTVFPEHIGHKFIADKFHRHPPCSAGFARLEQKDGKIFVVTFGESVMLNLRPSQLDEIGLTILLTK